MIFNQLSPITQRAVALGMVGIAILIAIEWIVSPIYNAIVSQHNSLVALREHRNFLASAKSWPELAHEPTIDRQLLVRGTGASTSRALHAAIIGIATRLGVSTNSMQVIENKNGNIRKFNIRLQIIGPHDAVLSFIAEVERGRPLMRVHQLNLAPTANRDGALTAQITFTAYGNVTQ